jgi:hypothetical protein
MSIVKFEPRQAAEQMKELLLNYRNQRDIIFGRMPVGLEISEFDALPARSVDISQSGEVNTDEIIVGFDESEDNDFPMFKDAFARFAARESRPRVVRIDTDATYDDFVSDRCCVELARQVAALREALTQHMSDGHGASVFEEVLGAAETIASLRRAAHSDEAVAALPKALVDIPDYALGKVQCWRDGDSIVCSMRFAANNGSPRIATMAVKPRIDEEAFVDHAERAGLDPVTVLGLASDVAEAMCGANLLRDTARAALAARTRDDVLGMDDEPLMLVSGGDVGAAPLAAVMYVQQRAQAGDLQAQREMQKLARVARTPLGRRIAAPLLAEANMRLTRGRAKKVQRPTFAQRYALMGMFV